LLTRECQLWHKNMVSGVRQGRMEVPREESLIRRRPSIWVFLTRVPRGRRGTGSNLNLRHGINIL